MQKKIFLSLSIALVLTACATEFEIASTDVPQTVMDSFHQKYPAATVQEWEVEKIKTNPMVFEVSFLLDGKDKEAQFRPDGTFVTEE